MKIFSPTLKGTTTVSGGTTNLSGSFIGTFSGSVAGIGGDVSAYSASVTLRTVNLEAASGSFSTRTTTLEAASGSFSTRTTNIERVYATTGSNTFTGAQTVQGTLTAQTLVVQTVTSSVLFSTGSNIIGSSLSNVQQITGSLYQTGSTAAFIGSVGIGVTSPNSKLQVLGGTITLNTQSTYALGVGNSSGYDLTFGTDSSNAYIQSWSSKPLQINPLGNNVVFPSSSVGIGTSTPVSALDVSGRISLGGALYTNVAQSETGAGTLASGYNFNLNSGTPVHQATGTMAGIWYNTGTIQFYTNSSQTANATATERMRITSAGNVVVGGTTAGTSLNTSVTVNNSSAGNYSGFIPMTADTQRGYYGGTNTGLEIGVASTGYLTVYTGGSERMRVTSVGNFDYGGYNPQSSNNSTYRQAFWGPFSIMWRNAEDSYINSNHTYGSSNTNVTTYTSSNGIGRLAMYGGNLDWSTYNGSVSAGSAYSLSTKFTVTKAGNVGIGIENPTSKLQVVGDIQMNSGGNAYFIFDRPNNGFDNVNIYRTNGTNKWILGARGESTEYFYLYSYGTSSNVVTVNYSSGYVGINDSNPSLNLDVNGNTRTQGSTMLGSNVGLLQYAMDGTRFNAYGYSVVHIKTSIAKGADTMISYNIRGYMYSPQTLDTDVAFYCYNATSSPYGVTISHKAYSGFTIGMYYSSDNYVCIYVDGLSTYGGFALNWVNTSLIQWGGRVYAIAWTKANTTAAQY